MEFMITNNILNVPLNQSLFSSPLKQMGASGNGKFSPLMKQTKLFIDAQSSGVHFDDHCGQ